MSLQSVVFQLFDELGIVRPTTIVGSSDQQTRQASSLLLRTGQRLVQDADWEALLQSATVTTVAGQEAYALPADFSNFIDETQWLQSAKVPVFGPMNQQDWAQNEFGQVNVGPYFRQQLRNGQLHLQPTPSTNGQVIRYYYCSNYWIKQGGSAPAATFIGDQDTFFLDEQLLLMGLKYRWLRAKGLSYDEERDEYDRMKVRVLGNDRGGRTLSMDPDCEVQGRQTGFIVPITGFGQ